MSLNLRNALSNVFVGTSGGGGATLAANTFTGAQAISVNGAASAPGMHITGVPFAGTGTTSFPQLYVNDSAATASTTLNTAGTCFGVNANGAQDLANLLTDGVSQFKVSYQGKVTLTNGILFKYDSGNASFAVRNTADSAYGRLDAGTVFADSLVVSNTRIEVSATVLLGTNGWLGNGGGIQVLSTGHIGFSSGALGAASNLFIKSAGAASLQLGIDHATTATNQTLKAHNVTTGTGADLILAGGTGSVAAGNVRFGTHSALGAETVTGYITIKDEAGNTRKLAVVS